MPRTFIASLLLVLYSELCVTLCADVAPPVFPGYTLSPFDTKSVFLKSEKVDIYYGDTCAVKAVFAVLNPTKEIVEKKIGFPFNVSAYRPFNRGDVNNATVNRIYDFTLNLNGETLVETDVPSGREIRSDIRYWYGWTCKFKPGLNIVKLNYHTLTSFGNSGYRWEKTLYYILNADKTWPGKTDTVQVTIHFPESISKSQVLTETSPPGFEIREKEISWRFTSFTPTSKSNINLHIMDFKVFADILNYEKFLSTPSAENATKLKAAIFFASMAPSKGIQMSAPTYFKRSYYDESVLPNLKSTERVMFDSTYKLHHGSRGADDYYSIGDYEIFSKNDTLRHRVLDVMNRIGYFEKIQYPLIYKYIEGSKKLFKEVVTSEPKNTAAWKAYIENYYLIETGACSPCLPWHRAECDCPESQKELVREAFRNCGNDTIIALWNSFMFPSRAPLPDTLEVVRSATPQVNVTIKIKHEDYSWSEKRLSPDELSLIKKVYTMSSDFYFVLNNTHVKEDTQKKLVELLGGCSLYRYKFCRDLEKLRNRGK